MQAESQISQISVWLAVRRIIILNKTPLIYNNVNIAVCCILNWCEQKIKLILKFSMKSDTNTIYGTYKINHALQYVRQTSLSVEFTSLQEGTNMNLTTGAEARST